MTVVVTVTGYEEPGGAVETVVPLNTMRSPSSLTLSKRASVVEDASGVVDVVVVVVVVVVVAEVVVTGTSEVEETSLVLETSGS